MIGNSDQWSNSGEWKREAIKRLPRINVMPAIKSSLLVNSLTNNQILIVIGKILIVIGKELIVEDQ